MLNLKKAFIVSIGLHGAAMLVVLHTISPLTMRGHHHGEHTLEVDLVAKRFPSSATRPVSRAEKRAVEKRRNVLTSQDKAAQSVKPRQDDAAKKADKTAEIINIVGEKAEPPPDKVSSENDKAAATLGKTVNNDKQRSETEDVSHRSANKTYGAVRSKGAAVSDPDFTVAILARIDAAKVYPRSAIRRGLEGVATLKFRLSPDGEVYEVALVQSSGFAVLDKASIRAIKKAAPFPYFDFWFKVSVIFKLT